MANHLTLGIYDNGQYKYNVVREEDLEQHIEYNKLWRFGRLLYVDGVRVYNGCKKEEYLAEYDEIARKFYEDNKNKIDMWKPTIPYR